MSLDTRLVAYLPNGASQGPLPSPESFDAALVLNDVGALSLTYGATAPRSDLLGQPLEVALEVSVDSGTTWTEPRNARYLYLQDGRDPVKDVSWSVQAPGYARRLAKALVPLTPVDANGQLQYVAKTIGFILNDLFTAAQARGAMAGMSWSFSATVDSSGAAWLGTKTLGFDAGKDFLSILQEWADLGDIDYAIQGRTVQVFKASTLGGDKTITTDPVSLRYGRDYTEAPFDRTWDGLADVALVQGDSGKTQAVTNAGAVRPWGRQETLVSAAGITDLPMLSIIGNLALSQTSDARTSYTHGLVFDQAKYTALVDYEPGSYVYSDVAAGTVTRMRVRQVTISSSGGVETGNVVLNDRFVERDIMFQRFITNALNGATPSTGGIPTPYGNDILPPATPLGLTNSSTTYLDTAQDQVRAVIVVDWADVTTNNDGTAATDIAGYEVWRAPLGGTFSLFEHTTSSLSTSSGYTPGTTWQFRVRAYDTVGNRGAFSSTVTQVAAGDTTAPGTPSTVAVLNVRLGAALLDWDKTLAAGGAMPPDFWYAEIHVSATNGFTATVGNPATLRETLTDAAQCVVTALAPGTYYARVVAVDTSGNVSPQSAQAAFTLLTVQGTEIDADTITARNILVGAGIVNCIGNPGFETGSTAPHSTNNGSSIFAYNGVGAGHSGQWCGVITAGLTRAAGAYGYDLTFNGPALDVHSHMPVQQGDVVYGECWVQANVGAPTTALFIDAIDSNGNRVSNTPDAGTQIIVSGAYAKASVRYTVPAGVAYVSLNLAMANTVAGSTQILVDDIVFSKKVTGTLIADELIGKIITGPLIRTSSTMGTGTGAGLLIENNATLGYLQFWLGYGADEVPMSLNPTAGITTGGAAGIAPALALKSVASAVNGITPAVLYLASSNSLGDGPEVQIPAGIRFQHKGTAGFWVRGPATFFSTLDANGALSGATLTSTTQPTSTLAANVRMGAAGLLNLVTSRSDAKVDPKPLTIERLRRLTTIGMVEWHDRGEYEENGRRKKGLRTYPGVLAEAVQDVDPLFADYHDDRLIGVAYDRLALAGLPLIGDLYDLVGALTDRVAELEERGGPPEG